MSTTFAGLFLLLFIFSFSYALWLRWRMKVSKARFARSVSGSIVSCLLACIMAVSSGLHLSIINSILVRLGFSPIEGYIDVITSIGVIIVTCVAILAIYRFGKHAMDSWDGPPHLSDSELSKDQIPATLLNLSMKDIHLFVQRRDDVEVPKEEVDWRDHKPEPPQPIEQHILLRDLFTSSMREAEIPDEGWRDQFRLWIGKIHTGPNLAQDDIFLFIFDALPSSEEMEERYVSAVRLIEASDNPQFFAVYPTSSGDGDAPKSYKISGETVKLCGTRQLIFDGLDLRSYARDLVRHFKNTKVGGTNATLENSYVELNAHYDHKEDDPRNAREWLEEWESEESNRHLAITGEFGQGKSTLLLKYCFDWAEDFLRGEADARRVPLLIELRGKNPAEEDPLTFISSWCARYGLLADKTMNLIKMGYATLIFEGFDELRNAGRRYDRHQHFNGLWKFAFPGSKVIFTGRPNFLIDEHETNTTLRTDPDKGSSGGVFTQVLRLEKIERRQLKIACRSYPKQIKDGMISAYDDNESFRDIISRPSMLPVVATIWPDIVKLRQNEAELTGALLIKRYLDATYKRKEDELEQDRVIRALPEDGRYLILPKKIRELLTMGVAWRMLLQDRKNTIPRQEIQSFIGEIYQALIDHCATDAVSRDISLTMKSFEDRFKDDSKADRIERMTSEICTSGLLVPDPVGGPTNLKFPHKQFYEYLIAISYTTSILSRDKICKIFFRNDFEYVVFRERNSIRYLIEIFENAVPIDADFGYQFIIRLEYLLLSRFLYFMPESKIYVKKVSISKNFDKFAFFLYKFFHMFHFIFSYFIIFGFSIGIVRSLEHFINLQIGDSALLSIAIIQALLFILLFGSRFRRFVWLFFNAGRYLSFFANYCYFFHSSVSAVVFFETARRPRDVSIHALMSELNLRFLSKEDRNKIIRNFVFTLR